MRRCYRGAALVLGGILMTGITSFNSCSIGSLTVYAAEDIPAEELETAFQEEVQTGEENVETEIQAEEMPAPEEVTEEPVQAVEEPVPTAEEPTQAVGTSFSLEEQEYQVLLKIVEAEAGCEDTAGKMLVANVVMNRVRSAHFPNSVYEVVYQRHEGRAQFSPIDDGRIDTVSVSADTVEAVARVMNGEDSSAGALFFRAASCNSRWFDQALTRVIEHGNHIFYTM
ncbi:MAG: cell wall hydrolase [Clostridiales bacterium]|nr:cell wall hydrolase [Clostridiales bacterium]